MEGLNFEQTVMYKLGNIERGIADLNEKVDKQNKATDERLKPLETTNKRLGWFMGAAVGLGAVLSFAIEKVGIKWLSLLS